MKTIPFSCKRCFAIAAVLSYLSAAIKATGSVYKDAKSAYPLPARMKTVINTLVAGSERQFRWMMDNDKEGVERLRRAADAQRKILENLENDE